MRRGVAGLRGCLWRRSRRHHCGDRGITGRCDDAHRPNRRVDDFSRRKCSTPDRPVAGLQGSPIMSASGTDWLRQRSDTLVTADGIAHAFGSRAAGFSYRHDPQRRRRLQLTRPFTLPAKPARDPAHRGRAGVAHVRGGPVSRPWESGDAVQHQRVPDGDAVRDDPLVTGHRPNAATTRWTLRRAA